MHHYFNVFFFLPGDMGHTLAAEIVSKTDACNDISQTLQVCYSLCNCVDAALQSGRCACVFEKQKL